MFGAGGGTSSYEEIEETDVILLWGSNAREAHPIFFHHLLKGLENGAKMFAVDPRRTSSAKFADMWLGLEVGSDIAMANTVANHIIANGWVDQEFVARSTEGYEAFAASVKSYSHMDQAPVQEPTDVARGIDSTVTMLGSSSGTRRRSAMRSTMWSTKRTASALRWRRSTWSQRCVGRAPIRSLGSNPSLASMAASARRSGS